MIYLKSKDFIILPIFYILLCFFIYCIQNYLIYFPSTSPLYNETVWRPLIQNQTLLGLESKDSYKKTIILFHGNAGSANDRSYYQHLFPNYHIIVAEYPGFGLNASAKISKENILNYARKLMTNSVNQYQHIVVVGESLGTGVASQMAEEFHIPKLLLITPYSSIYDIAHHKFWYLPISILLTNNYNNIENLQHYSGETLLLIAENDQIINPKYAFRLFDAIPGNKEKLVIHHAEHNNWLDYLSLEDRLIINNFL